jgi:hypothetical protein
MRAPICARGPLVRCMWEPVWCTAAPGTAVPGWCARAPDHRPPHFGTEGPLPFGPSGPYSSGTPYRNNRGSPGASVTDRDTDRRPASRGPSRRSGASIRISITSRVTMDHSASRPGSRHGRHHRNFCRSSDRFLGYPGGDRRFGPRGGDGRRSTLRRLNVACRSQNPEYEPPNRRNGSLQARNVAWWEGIPGGYGGPGRRARGRRVIPPPGLQAAGAFRPPGVQA